MVEEGNTIHAYFGRVYTNVSNYVNNYMTASDQEMQNNTDPIMDIITTAPSDSLYFIERINLISAIISISTSFPYLTYLFIYWDDCSCNDILRWWIVINSVLQLLQAPIRFFLYLLLRKYKLENERMHIEALRRLTSSKGWKLSKRFSLLNYLWFITGTVVMVVTRKHTKNYYLWFISWTIILSCIFRVFFTIVWFCFFFPYHQNIPKKKKGVPKAFFAEITTFKYSPDRKLKNESCSICLSDFAEKDEIFEFRCMHNFHTKCAKKWLSQRRQCPLCQRDVMKSD
ncbi:RING zinc finger protein, putative [Plasmodium chabaudi chabaudi]|uniref:RING zinc finger protein, putative n=1 Tax=Plasmodium chabaudi chabaudi TaxID=31271 RepID=A0A4V0KA23_PLACU|nr:RING zinc finger protein, putative [Plasmodium chabaudi chabaudi]VTZ69918.1 RING zinc finger protein, putative [Plasmodium chabaudi chabaudi]|eukprot:XP_740937.1 zinc finger protein, putative [Plasmodium chabaudi chabaudi]